MSRLELKTGPTTQQMSCEAFNLTTLGLWFDGSAP
jgi:hypothetical protein